MSELKACPFCGSKAIPSQEEYFYKCSNRNCPNFGDYPIDLWNTRPIEETQAKLIIQLGDALDSAGDGGLVYPDQVEAEKAYEDWREKNK